MLVHVLRECNLNRILLSCAGFWPYQNKLLRLLIPTVFITLQITYLPIEMFMLYENIDSGQMVFEICYQTSVTIAFLVKMLNQVLYRDKFRHLYESMENHWNVFTNDLEIRILKDYSIMSQKFTKSYAIIIYFMMSMFLTIPALAPMLLDVLLPLNESRPRNLPIFVEIGVDVDQHFIPMFCYVIILVGGGMCTMVAGDTMHIVCTAHACSLFRVIGQQIENLMSNVNASDEVDDESQCCDKARVESLREEMIYREYIVCLRKHQLAIQFVDVLNDTHKLIGITFALISALVLSLVGVRIVYVLDQLEELFRFVVLLMGTLIQLMILCYPGQKLMDESQNIFHRAYAMEWYRSSPRIKSLLMITLHRSIIPCSLTAADLFPLSMTIFSTVVRTGMSYFTAFLSLKDK